MDIEITTTTKKLTESLIKQMPLANILVLEHGEPLGYVNINNTSLMIIKYYNEYFTMPNNYIFDKKRNRLTRSVKNKIIILDLKSKDHALDFWRFYQVMKNKCDKHIYI